MTQQVSPDAAGPAGYAESVLRSLYPAPLRVVPSADADDPGAPPLARYLLLPTPRRARILVPAGSPAGAARSLHRQMTGPRRRTRIARALLTAAVRSGAADRLARGGLAVVGPADSDSVTRELAAVLGRAEVLITLPVTPPRANRKPVLQLCDEAGTVLAFVKVGHDALTRQLVGDEARHLGELAGAGLAHVRVPRVLAHRTWQDLELLVLEPLDVPRSRLSGGAARTALLTVAREVAAVRGLQTAAWAETPLRRSLAAQLQGGDPRSGRLLHHVHGLDAAHAGTLQVGAWHGDLNPGNAALGRTRSLVWDWERFQHGVPLGLDLLHHDLHVDLTVTGSAPADAALRLLAQAPAALAPLGVGPAEADVTARAYLLALAARYLHDHQSEAGAELGRVETWLLPALDAHPPV